MKIIITFNVLSTLFNFMTMQQSFARKLILFINLKIHDCHEACTPISLYYIMIYILECYFTNLYDNILYYN